MTGEAHTIEALSRVSRSLFDSFDLERIPIIALETALEEVRAQAGSILLADPEHRTLVFQYSIGEKPVPRGTAIPWDRGIAGAVFQSGEAQLTLDAQKSAQHFDRVDAATGFETRDMITVPLKRWGGAPIGVLNALNKRDGTLDQADLDVLTVIASFAAMAIEHARLFEQERLAEIARMLGNIGHDLKNLLTPVISCADLLDEELRELFERQPPTAEVQASRELCFDSLGAIHKSAGRIRHRVKEIADCVKGRSSPPTFAPLQLALVVADVFAALGPLAQERAITLEAEGLEALPALVGDESRIYTAFYNLVINAIPEISGAGRVAIRGRRDGEWIEIEIADDGRGMEPAVRDRLFSQNPISRTPGGTGLGTKIVRDVMDAHRGSIAVESTLGAGTTFTLRFPLEPR